MDGRNFFEFAGDFITDRVNDIKSNIDAISVTDIRSERIKCCAVIASNFLILAGIIVIGIFIIHHTIQFGLSIIAF